MKRLLRLLPLFLIGLALLNWAPPAHAQTPARGAVVRAVLFYSPNCSHCQQVITEVLPPLFERYGSQLSMVGVDVTQSGGQALFQAALQHFNLESSGVPLLVVGKTYLIGSVDIPEQFPSLIEQYLAQGGVDWPAIPGLAEMLAASQPAALPTTATIKPPAFASLPTIGPMVTPGCSLADATAICSAPSSTASPGAARGLLLTGKPPNDWRANLARDAVGNSLAIIVLLGMLVSLGRAAIVCLRVPGAPLTQPSDWLIPALCLAGMGVAGYLAYVETAQVSAVCGPVGDCNTVQQSAYARLFGVLPMGGLGLLGYVAILAAWVVRRLGRGRLTDLATLALLGMIVFGTLFSIYLTFLEPFIIGATCAWCLTSAMIMTALLWLALPSGRQAITHLHQGDSHAG